MLQLSSQKTTAQGENLVPVGLCKELFPLKGSKRRREDSSGLRGKLSYGEHDILKRILQKTSSVAQTMDSKSFQSCWM
ncbi:uncharacterized protein ACOB8E_005571 isoform 2-T2 [Sarcophilus harrisii]